MKKVKEWRSKWAENLVELGSLSIGLGVVVWLSKTFHWELIPSYFIWIGIVEVLLATALEVWQRWNDPRE